ncbi:hypothetical protein [Acrocarpospora corrugata]|uniref:hypothetical protein n=1 Tax=Acrocarpospora corrugata TaxID=35763 RepID=UPI0014780A0B|nr:hypothetical protein [Acrocarpospora corrugata]
MIAIRAQQTAIGQRDVAASQVLAARSEQAPDDDPRLAAAAWQAYPTAEARYSMMAVLTRPLRAVFPTRDGYPTSVAFSPDGRTLASSSSNPAEGWVRMLAGFPPDLLAAMCAIPGDSLTRDEWAVYAPDVVPTGCP